MLVLLSGSIRIRSITHFFHLAFRRICNPSLKNVLTPLCSGDLQSVVKKCPTSLCSGDLQSPVIGSGSFVIGGLQIPRFHRSNLFYGGFQIRRDGFQIRRDGRIGCFLPLGVSTDLQSVVKKCPNLFVPGDL